MADREIAYSAAFRTDSKPIAENVPDEDEQYSKRGCPSGTFLPRCRNASTQSRPAIPPPLSPTVFSNQRSGPFHV